MGDVSTKNVYLSDILNLWDADKSAASMMNLAADLFPIHRTLINSGYKKSLEMIAELLPIEIEKYASGLKAWDWTIPNAWDVKEAWIADSHGNKLVEFADNNLHLSQYSAGFDGMISHNDLMEHLYWREDLHDAIPFNFLYFNDSGKWQFNIAFTSLKKFIDENYHVHIDVEVYPDFLRIGSLYLPGKSDKEVIVSTYLCHPSMANDNLSGIVAAMELFKILQQYEDRYYSYRLLILPETIGSITWMANHEEQLDRIVAGLVISNCGDSGPVTYKQTYSGSNEIDLIAGHILSQSKLETEVKSYTPSGSDERQYNSPNLRLPVGCLVRSGWSNYREYHTSLDRLDAINGKNLWDTVKTAVEIFDILDSNRILKIKVKGEPFMSQYTITYPHYYEDRKGLGANPLKVLLHELNGKHTLLEIAEKWGKSFQELRELAWQLQEQGIAEQII